MKHLFDKQNKYSIRKLSVGVCSAVIGLSILGAGTVYADEPATPASTTDTAAAAPTEESVADTSATRSTISSSPAVNNSAVINNSTNPPVPVAIESAEASTEAANHTAAAAIDNDENTYWQSQPTANGDQTLTVKMAALARVDSITYMPRQVTPSDPTDQAVTGAEYHRDHHPGLMTKGKIEYSTDGTTWHLANPVSLEGDTANNSGPNPDKTISFGANNRARTVKIDPVDAQYFRLTVLESWAGAASRVGNTGIVTAATFKPSGVVPTTQTPPTSNLVTELSNQTLTTANGTKIALGEDVKTHLKTGDSGTVYIEFRAPENNAILYTLFNATSGTDQNQYTALYSKSGQIGAEIRPGVTIDLNDGTERAKNGEWNAVALTYEKNPANDKNIVKIYVNGVLSTTREIEQDVFKDMANLQHAQIGAAQRVNGPVWGLNGLEVRNFKLYNNALTEAEVLDHSAQFIREPQTLPTNPHEVVSDKVVVFQGGRNNQRHEGVHAFRIPALLKTDKGTLIAATDQRHSTSGDWGDIATVIKRSTDNGATWGETIKIVDLKNSDTGPASSDPMTIDPGLVQDPTTKRIFAIYDMFPDEANASGMGGAFGLTFDRTPAHSIIDGKTYVNVFKNGETEAYTVRENGVIHTPTGEATNYRVNVNDSSAAYANLGDVFEGDGTTPVGNIYHRYDTTSPFKVMNQMFIWMSYSDDDGLTWSRPKDITTSVKKDYMSFLGVGPGAGIVLKHGPNKGRLVIPAYSANYQPHPSSPLYNGSQSMLFFYSDDCGETWHSGESVNDNRTLADGTVIHSSTMSNAREQLTESTVVQLRNGDLKVFLRGLTGKLTMATSKDGGLTFESDVVRFDDVNEVGVQLSAVQFERDNKEYIVLANAEGPGRANGHVRVAEVQPDGNLKWINHRQIEEGAFAYNSLQYLGNDEFGLIYESKINGENDYTQRYRKFNWAFLTSPAPKLPDNNVASVSFDDANGTATLTFEETVLSTNNPTLLLSNGRTVTFASQPDAKSLTFNILPADKGATVLAVQTGDISNVNGLKVNPVVKLAAGTTSANTEVKIDNKALSITAGNLNAWQPGQGPDKLLDGNKDSVAELKWDMASNYVNGAYPTEWKLPQSVTVTTREGQPLKLSSLLITKRTPGNGTMTKYKVEAFNGDTRVHTSNEVTVPFETAEVAYSFGSTPVEANRVVLTILEAKRDANGPATPTMMTLRELALYGSGTTTREREVPDHVTYNIVDRMDKTLPVGTYRVETAGVHGQVVKKVRETFTNGLLTATEVLDDNVRTIPAVDEVVVRGPRLIKTKERTVKETLAFGTERVADPDMLEAAPEVVERDGVNGSVDKIFTDRYADCLCEEANLIDSQLLREENRVEPVTKIIRYGTKKPETPPSDDNTGGGTGGTNTGGTTPDGTDTGGTTPGGTDTGGTTPGGTDTGGTTPGGTDTGGTNTGGTDTGGTNTGGTNTGGIDTGGTTPGGTNTGGTNTGGTNTGGTNTGGTNTGGTNTGGTNTGGITPGTPGGTTTPTTPLQTTQPRPVETPIPFTVEEIMDPTLEKGKVVVEREGVNGRLIQIFEDTYVDGVKKVDGTRLAYETKVDPVTKKVRIGTKVSDTRRRQQVTPLPVGPDGSATSRVQIIEEVYVNGVLTESRPVSEKVVPDAEVAVGRRRREVVTPYGSAASRVQVFEDITIDGKPTESRLISDTIVPNKPEGTSNLPSRPAQKPAPQTTTVVAPTVEKEKAQETGSDKVAPVAAASAASARSTSASSSSTASLPKTGEAETGLAILGAASLVASLGIVSAKRRKD